MFEDIEKTSDTMLRGVMAHDENEWYKFYLRYQRLCVYIGKRYRLPEFEIEDLTSRTMLKFNKLVEEKKFQRDPEKSFRAYFARIVHSTAMDMFREKKRDGNVFEEWPTDEEGRQVVFPDEETILSQVEYREKQRIYFDARHKLEESLLKEPKKYRCWQLSTEEGWPVKKIVSCLGLPQSTVYWNISDCFQKLGEILRELTGDDTLGHPPKISLPKKTEASHMSRGEILEYICNDSGFLTRRRVAAHLKKCAECAAVEAEIRKELELQAEIVAGARQFVADEEEVEATMTRFQNATTGMPPEFTGFTPRE